MKFTRDQRTILFIASICALGVFLAPPIIPGQLAVDTGRLLAHLGVVAAFTFMALLVADWLAESEAEARAKAKAQIEAHAQTQPK